MSRAGTMTSDHRAGSEAGVADAAAGLPNRLSVKDDPARWHQSAAWCNAYDKGYRWRAYGPGRFAVSDRG